jgi:endonuclease-8
VPEGDTVYLASTRLNAALAGQALTRTDFRVPRYAEVDLAQRVVEGVIARGKHLLFRISEDLTLHTHFKMEGTWHLYRPRARWQGPLWQVRAVLYTESWVAVGFRLPVIDLIARDREEQVIGHVGPDPLGDDWDEVEAVKRVAADPTRSIGEALIDQSNIAGLGNVYRCEVCFLRGIRPDRPVRDVPDLPEVVALAARLLRANRMTGSQVTTGDKRPGRQRWVYARKAEPCRRCGTAIVKQEEGPPGSYARVTYLCPTCQPA